VDGLYSHIACCGPSRRRSSTKVCAMSR
jgi:hypothetical protein